jgi:putative glutamine amidotransferase
MKKTIGVLDCSKYDAYANWIAPDANVEVVKLGYALDNFLDIHKCDGILLTGGEDVHPKFYNKMEYLPLCHEYDMDERRDEFELKVIDYIQKNQLPLLGICRGLQITNVYFGGTLIPDIPTSGRPDHSKLNDKDRYHNVNINLRSELFDIVENESGEVNSAHHQSADSIGSGLKVSATSPDGIIEALEREHPDGKSFLMLVQWHPERMIDQESPFTKNIKQAFLKSIK